MEISNIDKEKLSVNIEDGNWISIRSASISFYGNYSKSENGKYILAWKDGMTDISTEEEKLVYGDFLLLENQNLILKGALERPNDGKVANNGTFIINNWLHFGGELAGIFMAYNKHGGEIVNHRFTANLKNNGLSSDGRFAVCQTWHSNTTDGDKVTCFDLETGNLLWQKIPETKSADAFKLDLDRNVIFFSYSNMGDFRYSLSGKFLDNENWYQARLKHGSAFDLIEIADKKLTPTRRFANPDDSKEILGLYLLAIKRGIAPYYLAQTHRKIGEIYEQLGENDKAIIHYEQALKHNPKVGVIQKLQKLKPPTQEQEERSPFSIRAFPNGSIQLLKTGKSVQAGVAPRGTYFQTDHYNDACWYIKNNYKDGLEKGSASISITNQYGELLSSFEVNHLIFKTKRALNSNYFIAISYDLMLNLYSPSLKLLSSKNISTKVKDRYDLKQADLSSSGDLITVAINNDLIFLNNELRVIKEIEIPLVEKVMSIKTKIDNLDITVKGTGREDISAIQINDDNMYFGTSWGEVFRFTRDGSKELVYKCDTPILEIRTKNHSLLVVCKMFADIVTNSERINRIQRIEGFGKFIWGDQAALECTKQVVKLFTYAGLPIADLEFNDSIADAYLSGNDLIVFTSKKSFIYSFSTT